MWQSEVQGFDERSVPEENHDGLKVGIRQLIEIKEAEDEELKKGLLRDDVRILLGVLES